METTRPVKHQRAFWDGHHREHNVGFLEFCDGRGVSDMVFGWTYGAMNDIQIWNCSPYYNNIQQYIGNTQVLFDGIFEFVDGPFLTPIRDASTPAEIIYNCLQREARVIIENKFARTKVLWPLIGLKYNLDIDLIGLVYYNCVLLTNIIILVQDPLRASE